MNTKLVNKPYISIKNDSIFSLALNRINSEHNGSTVIIPHICNNIGVFGGGFTGAIDKYFPEVKANYSLLGNKMQLGHTQYVTVKTNEKYKYSIIFANMIAQNKIISKSNPRPINYAALVYCMNSINQFIKTFQHTYESIPIEIHAPKFGSGLARGNWNFISYLIEDIWKNHTIFIYEQ